MCPDHCVLFLINANFGISRFELHQRVKKFNCFELYPQGKNSIQNDRGGIRQIIPISKNTVARTCVLSLYCGGVLQKQRWYYMLYFHPTPIHQVTKTMSGITIVVPVDIVQALRLPPDTLCVQAELHQELTLALYQRGILSSGKACFLQG